jgi:multidrug efflux pump subunit AcrA (membrane-fusion protein)
MLAASRVLLIALVGCSGQAKPAASPSPPSVATIQATDGTIYPTLQIAGVIVPYRQVGIAADLTEPITDVDVQEGDHVRAGQVLAHLQTDDLQAQLASAQRIVGEDTARYSQTTYQVSANNALDQSAVRSAQASLKQDEVTLSGALTDLQRYAALAAQGYLPQQTVDEQRTTVSSDQQAVAAARAALAQAIGNARANGNGANAGEQLQEIAAAREAADSAEASVVQLRREIARAVLVSPVDGIVDAVNANPGEYPTSRELFTIEQTAQVYAVLPASTAQVTQVRAGADATIVAAGSTRHDAGHVAAVLDQIEPGTTNFTVKVLVQNADGHLHGGMPVTATVSLPPVSGIEVPETAYVDDTHASIYVIAGGVVRTQPVTEVAEDGKNAIVTGVPAGSVVLQNVEDTTVGNGDRVAVNAK